MLRYCQYYSVVFGGYVALALWMTKYYVAEYGFDIKHAAFLAACFSLPGGVLRALGGWLSDRYGAYKVTWGVMWTCWVAFFILSYPQTHFIIQTVNGPQGFDIGLTSHLVQGVAAVWRGAGDGHRQGVGIQVDRRRIPRQHRRRVRRGGPGRRPGRLPAAHPVRSAVDLTGVRSSSFMLLYGTVCVSLVWMHFSFKPLALAAAKR